MDPNATTDQPQDQPVVPPAQPTWPSEPVATPEPTIPEPAVPAEPVVPVEPVAVPQTPAEGGGMDGDTTPPIPGV